MEEQVTTLPGQLGGGRVHRVLADDTALRQELRDATEAASLPRERLEGTRDNNQFFADLEVEINDRRRPGSVQNVTCFRMKRQ